MNRFLYIYFNIFKKKHLWNCIFKKKERVERIIYPGAVFRKKETRIIHHEYSKDKIIYIGSSIKLYIITLIY